LLELLASRLLGRNGAIELVGAQGSALRLGVEAVPLVALVRQLLLQPRGRRERLVSLNKGRRDAVVTVERRTGAPVGHREPPLADHPPPDRERAGPSPPPDPHQPLALRTGERRLCERCRHAAGRRRLSVAVAQRKAQSSKRGALFKRADPVLELDRLRPSGLRFLQSQALYRPGCGQFGIGPAAHVLGVGSELLSVTAVFPPVAATPGPPPPHPR